MSRIFCADNALIVKESRLYTDLKTELTVVTGFLEAPGGVELGIQPGSLSGSNLHSVQLIPTAEDSQKIEALTSGERFRKIEEGNCVFWGNSLGVKDFFKISLPHVS